MEEQQNRILHDFLKTMICPAMEKLLKSQVEIFIDALNDRLSDTPFMLLLSGDGVIVMLRSQAVQMAKHMFNRP